MAERLPARSLIAALFAATFALLGCVEGGSSTTSRSATVASEQADPDLARQAAAMQKTILEGAIAGAAVGGGVSLGLGGDRNQVQLGTLTGLGVGAVAGSYVAFVQQRYASKERRLKIVKEDLDENAAEMQATIAVMQRVLAEQQAQLRAVRARAAAGKADPATLEQTVTTAQANLAEMQRAVDGAASRQAEFNSTRSVVPVSGGASAIDPELAQLSATISAMRSIALDLERELAL